MRIIGIVPHGTDIIELDILCMDNRTAQAVTNGIVVALPTVVFVLVANTTSLFVAAISAAAIAITAFVLKAVRKQPLAPAVAGLSIVIACVVVALCMGQKRAFFLLPAIVLPVAIGIATVVSILIRKPLAGVVLNGVAGGPRDWQQHRELRSLYTAVTWVCFTVNAASGFLQRFFYVNNQLVGLAIVHILVPIAFSAIIAVTILQVRHRLTPPLDAPVHGPIENT
jgi:uncharacterized protein DUF3159